MLIYFSGIKQVPKDLHSPKVALNFKVTQFLSLQCKKLHFFRVFSKRSLILLCNRRRFFALQRKDNMSPDLKKNLQNFSVFESRIYFTSLFVKIHYRQTGTFSKSYSLYGAILDMTTMSQVRPSGQAMPE